LEAGRQLMLTGRRDIHPENVDPQTLV